MYFIHSKNESTGEGGDSNKKNETDNNDET